jgi:hypothetical protein
LGSRIGAQPDADDPASGDDELRAVTGGAKSLDDRNDALELPKIHRVPRYISAEHRSNEIEV